MAAGLLRASIALATHVPQVSDVVAVATNSTYNMGCKAGGPQVDCTAADFDFTWSELATIKPGGGDLTSLYTVAALSAFSFQPPLDSYFRTWMSDLQAVPCNGTSRALAAFVASVGNLTSQGTVTPLTISGECNLTGGLTVVRNVDGTPTEYDYWINSFVIVPPTPSPTPSPSPTVMPTATAKPTATARPTATASATTTPTPLRSGPESASASESESSSASATPSATPADTPEQSVKGETFTPEPSRPEQARDEGIGGWPGSVAGAADISTKAADIGGSALAALLLLVAMGFIGELFNNTMETNYDRILTWWRESWLGRIGHRLGGLFGGGSS